MKETDIIIIGAGPAGMTAAIYALRANKRVVLFEKENIGGQLSRAVVIENYPGVDSISGLQLSMNMYKQIEELGGEITFEEVLNIQKKSNGDFNVITDEDIYVSKSVIVAVGSSPCTLGLPFEDKIVGHGVHFCVTCDGSLYKDRIVTVIGDGNTAAQYAIELAKYCKKVNIISNAKKLFCEKKSEIIIQSTENICIYYNTDVVNYWIDGRNVLQGLFVHNNIDDDCDVVPTNGVFLAIGNKPASINFNGSGLNFDRNGAVLVDENTSASIEGMFIAGDCRSKPLHQVVGATSDGAMAAINAIKYLNK